MEIDGDLDDMLGGLAIGQEYDEFKEWAEKHSEIIRETQGSEHPYNKLWVEQRLRDIELALASKIMLVTKDPNRVSIDRIVMKPNSSHTLFLMLDRPDAQIGDSFEIDILQEDVKKEQVIGGLSTRVELVPQPRIPTKYQLKLWTHRWFHLYTVVRATLLGPDDRPIPPDDGAKIMLYEETDEGIQRLDWMRWHRGWRSFYAFYRGVAKRHFMAEGYMMDKRVAMAKTES
jgi:hypothetical protein